MFLQVFTRTGHFCRSVLWYVGFLTLNFDLQPHGDGPAYYPTVATLSLGSHTILDIFAYADDGSMSKEGSDPSHTPSKSRTYDSSTPLFSVLLPRRSLFILKDELYSGHLHGIAERTADTMEDLRKCINWEDISSRRSRWEMGDESDSVEKWYRTRRVSVTMRSVEKVLKNVVSR